MYGTQDAVHIWQLDYVNLICGELGGFQRGKHSAPLFHNSNEDVMMAVHGSESVCLSGGGGLKHFDKLLKSKYTAKDMGILGLEDSDVKSVLLWKPVFRVGTVQIGQFLDIELDLRHVSFPCGAPKGRQSQPIVVLLHEEEFDYFAREWLFRSGTSCMPDLGEVHVHRARNNSTGARRSGRS